MDPRARPVEKTGRLLPSVSMRRHGPIRVDLCGETVHLEQALVVELRDAAAARAGTSSRHHDLSLLLNRSLTTGSLTLRRSKLRTLIRLALSLPEHVHPAARRLQQGTWRARVG
jgi:hypothetical protein